MKNSVLVILFVFISDISYGQRKNLPRYSREQKRIEKQERINLLINQEEEGAIIFKKQTVFGLKLNTDGYGIFLEKGAMKTSTKVNLYSIELGERKHEKEEKIKPAGRSYHQNGYVYGKINNFYYAKFGLAKQRLIGNKGNKNGVAIHAIYGGGLIAGLLKPYYIKVSYPSIAATIRDVKYNNNDDVFLNNPQLVYGASSFPKGFNEIKVTPGAFLKGALRFDYARYNTLVSAVEVGLNFEAYSNKMPQMLIVKNKQLFFNAYAAIAFGKRK